MVDILVWATIGIASLFILIKAADYFTNSAEELGLFLGIPAFLVGVTIVAIGTSLPELVSSVIAVLQKSSEFVAGNVVGSNIANIFLIVGIAAVVAKRLTVTYELIRVDLPLLVGSAFLFAFVAYDGIITLPESLVCLAGAVLYIWYVVNTQRKRRAQQREVEKKIKKEMRKEKRSFTYKDVLIMIGGALGIYLGSRYTVEAVVHLSPLLSIGKDVIAASAVALGTSLPELVVSLRAAQRGNPAIALGNVLGSNIFNVFLVTGTAGLFGTLVVSSDLIHFGLPVMLVATLLYFFTTQDKEITLWEGWMFIGFYALFLAKLFMLF